MSQIDNQVPTIVREFLDGVCKSLNHYQHVEVAWHLLQKMPLTQAIERFASGAKALAEANGQPQVYHETVTWAYMISINERMFRRSAEGQSAQNWDTFCEENSDLFAKDKGWLKKLYREETIASEHARKVFVLPDFGIESDNQER